MGSVISDGDTDTALILPMQDLGSSFLRSPQLGKPRIPGLTDQGKGFHCEPG